MVGTNKDSAFVTFGRTAVNPFAGGCNVDAVAIAEMRSSENGCSPQDEIC